jgi:hypothetical protein
MISVTPEQVRQITHDTLARPEFDEKITWTQLVLDRILEWLGAVARWSERNPDAALILVYALTVALIVLIGHIVYTVVREFRSLRRPSSNSNRQQPIRALEGIAQNWADAFQLAKAALDAGDLYRALWITHRVMLSVLDRTGRIKFVRWKTNSDYLRECGDNTASGATLSELTGAYERVIYAHTEFDQLQALKLLEQVENLATEAGR